MVDPNYVPINIYSAELKFSPSTLSFLEDNQHDTKEEAIILAELEHRKDACSNPPKEMVSGTPSDNDSNSSPAVISSAEYHKDTSPEADHEESAPETREQLSLRNSPVSGMRDDTDNGSRSRDLEISTFPTPSSGTVDQIGFQSGACINPLGDYISEELIHIPLTHTDSSLATGNTSDSDTPIPVSFDNTVPYQMEYTASPSTTLDDFITDSNILSSSSSEQSQEETGPMATVPTLPASTHTYTLGHVGLSQILAEDTRAQTLHDDSSTCLPDSPDIVIGDCIANGTSIRQFHPELGSPPPHNGISSSSCQFQLRYSSAGTRVHSTGSSTQMASFEEDADYNMLSSYYDCTDAHDSNPACLPRYFVSSGDRSMDGYVLEVLQDIHSSS